MVVYRVVAPSYFKGETLPRRGAHDLVLAGMAEESEGERRALRTPGAGMPDMVIAPDRSNLPEGATAVDAQAAHEDTDDQMKDPEQPQS